MRNRHGALVAALTAAAAVVPAAGAEAATAATAATAVKAAALPAPGSWAVGYSAMVRGSGKNATTASLQLVGPSGGVVKTIATGLPAWEVRVHDVQHDLGRVVTAQRNATDTATIFTVWDVRAGTKKSFGLTAQTAFAQLTQDGLITVHRPKGGANITTRRSYSGQLLRTFTRLTVGRGETAVSPGGTVLMQRSSTGVVLRRTTDGSVVRTITRPSGMASCGPLGLWGQGYVKMRCDQVGDKDEFAGRVYAVSTTKGSPIPVSPVGGYWDAWPTAKHRSYLVGGDETVVGRIVGGYPAEWISGTYMQDGLGAHGSSMWIGGLWDGWVKRQDTVSGKVTGVAGPGTPTGGYVFNARLVDTVS